LALKNRRRRGAASVLTAVEMPVYGGPSFSILGDNDAIDFAELLNN